MSTKAIDSPGSLDEAGGNLGRIATGAEIVELPLRLPRSPGKDVAGTARPLDKPHHLGHRERLRQRFRLGGADALPDYELLELLLFRALPRQDVKPLAKALVARFGSFAEVVAAPSERLKEVPGVGEAVVTELMITHAAARRVTKGEITRRTLLTSWNAVIDYCRAAMAFAEREQFRML